MGDGSKQQRRKRCESQVSMNLAVARKLEHTLGSRTSILRSVELSPLSLARLPLGSGLLPWAQKRRVHCTVGGSGEGGGAKRTIASLQRFLNRAAVQLPKRRVAADCTLLAVK